MHRSMFDMLAISLKLLINNNKRQTIRSGNIRSTHRSMLYFQHASYFYSGHTARKESSNDCKYDKKIGSHVLPDSSVCGYLGFGRSGPLFIQAIQKQAQMMQAIPNTTQMTASKARKLAPMSSRNLETADIFDSRGAGPVYSKSFHDFMVIISGGHSFLVLSVFSNEVSG